MKIEHVAFCVENPAAMAKWYVEHLGMRVARAAGAPTHTHFLIDSAGTTALEIYNNPSVSVPDYRSVDPLVFHLAFAADDVIAERRRLARAGATMIDEITLTDAGDEMAMLRDPWGVPVQLVKRAHPLA